LPARTQSGVAISPDGDHWFLINASPDLGAQMNAFPPLHPNAAKNPRQSKIAGVLLTNADLDHVLGLLLLREGPPLAIHATAAVRESLAAAGIENILAAFCGLSWLEPSADPVEIEDPAGAPTGLFARAIFLPGAPPPYAKTTSHPSGHSIAWQIHDRRTGARLLAAPDVAAIDPPLAAAIADSDLILFDGTFWSGDELLHVRPGARTAEEMGHIPIQASLDTLRASPAGRKVYFHINNTNPILAPGPERAAVEQAGIMIGYDGLEFDL
jgi:pyrroloquinoline quinone biosynthesis protein B